MDTVFVHLVDFEADCTAKQWERKTLNNKLIVLERFFPPDINAKIHSIRQLGNTGAHQKGHSSLTDKNVDETLKTLSRVCEWTIFSYFQKNGFNHDSWMPTIFSTLQPAYRIRILEDLFASLNINTDELIRHQNLVQENHRQIFSGEISPDFNYVPSQKERELAAILLVIDKLAMAYLKNKERNKSKEFIEACFNKGVINEQFRFEMNDKLDLLWSEIDGLPIAQSMEDTIYNFEQVMKAVRKEDESLFVTMFTAVISQNES